ncbi:hypothetical protein ACJVDH_00410 [Pedobacter sp. AW1-32]|uniref:hypothetical protein n=1 Tax=Pedobacter sp. AW1-32 TaxID=3383026 RepID=UPI003FEE521C
MSWEIIGGICAIIGIGYTIYQVNIQPKQDLDETRMDMLGQFMTSQRLIDNLIADLKYFASKGDNGKRSYNRGLTIDNFIHYLEDMRDRELSKSTYDMISKTQFSKQNYETFNVNIRNQIKSLNECQTYFDTHFKYSDTTGY